MPAAHALLQAAEDIERAVLTPVPLGTAALWARPGGAASVGFHLRHIAGSIDRLLTYADGRQLNDQQRETLAAEGVPGDPPAQAEALAHLAREAVLGAIAMIRATSPDSLHEAREVGRQRLPSTVLGLLFHVAEHTQRHVGQIVATAKIVRALEARWPEALGAPASGSG
jgi:hypothetical protein